MHRVLEELEQEDARRRAAFARSLVANEAISKIFEIAVQNTANIKKKESSLTPARLQKMKTAHKLLSPSKAAVQPTGGKYPVLARPISPIAKPQALVVLSPNAHNKSKGSPTVDRKEKTSPKPKVKQVPPKRKPTPKPEPVTRKPDAPILDGASLRKKRIAELHQKRLVEMEMERQRRLKAVEQVLFPLNMLCSSSRAYTYCSSMASSN